MEQLNERFERPFIGGHILENWSEASWTATNWYIDKEIDRTIDRIIDRRIDGRTD